MGNFHTHNGTLFVGKRDTALRQEWARRYNPEVVTLNERPYTGEAPQEFDEHMDYLAGGGDSGFPRWQQVAYWTLLQTAPGYQNAHDEAWNIVCFEQYSPDNASEKDYQRREAFLRNAGYSL